MLLVRPLRSGLPASALRILVLVLVFVVVAAMQMIRKSGAL
ncbi:hypothetical protein [Paraburkholderia sp. BL6665CI2N2]|nr:hypothetical protein [Paraburkholderia sp. BL6665CI2N2]